MVSVVALCHCTHFETTLANALECVLQLDSNSKISNLSDSDQTSMSC